MTTMIGMYDDEFSIIPYFVSGIFLYCLAYLFFPIAKDFLAGLTFGFLIMAFVEKERQKNFW